MKIIREPSSSMETLAQEIEQQAQDDQRKKDHINSVLERAK